MPKVTVKTTIGTIEIELDKMNAEILVKKLKSFCDGKNEFNALRPKVSAQTDFFSADISCDDLDINKMTENLPRFDIPWYKRTVLWFDPTKILTTLTKSNVLQVATHISKKLAQKGVGMEVTEISIQK